MTNQTIIPASDITQQDWYVALVEECQAIVTEGIFNHRWALVEMYHHLGERIVTENNLDRKAAYGQKIVTRVSQSIRIGVRDIWRAIQFYEKYPDLSLLPLGKNSSWKQVIALLPAPKDKTPVLPNGQYGVIYADPPWKYVGVGVNTSPNYGAAAIQYESMSIEQLCALPVRALAAEDCVLFLWVTSPILDQVWPVIKAWGFEYKASFVWDKVKHNYGFYNSVRHEFLLICGRGKSTPEVKKLYDSVQTIERSPTHSEKPPEFREIIESLYQSARKVELFARCHAPGWESWGDELS